MGCLIELHNQQYMKLTTQKYLASKMFQRETPIAEVDIELFLSDVPPSVQRPGAMWLEPNNCVLKFWDSHSMQWQTVANTLDTTIRDDYYGFDDNLRLEDMPKNSTVAPRPYPRRPDIRTFIA